MPEGWQKFFDGLSDDEKLILSDLNGPSWSPEKKIKIFKPIVSPDKIDDKQNEELKLELSELKKSKLRTSYLEAENKKLQAMVDQGGEVLNKQAANNAVWAKQNAQAMYKTAYEAGDADKMAEAQELLSKAVLAEQTATNMASNVQQEIEKELVNLKLNKLLSHNR